MISQQTERKATSAVIFSLLGGGIGGFVTLLYVAGAVNLGQNVGSIIIIGSYFSITSFLIIIFAIKLFADPLQHSKWGILIIVFSGINLFGLLGIVGGILALRHKPGPTYPLTDHQLSPQLKPMAPPYKYKPSEKKAAVFISYVEEDTRVAYEIANGLDKAGYPTWYYERDAIPGPSYLMQVSQAIEQIQALVVVISPHSLSSNQVTKEIIHAHESSKFFIPVLHGITHVEFQNRQPEWREAIGSATSIRITEKGVLDILPRIIAGLERLGVHKANLEKDE